MNMSPELEKKCGMYLHVAFSNKVKWARITAVAFLFTAASLTQLFSQSIRMLEQLKTKDNNLDVNLDVNMKCSNFKSSVSSMWNTFGDKIMKASHFPEEHASSENFTN